MYSNDKEQSIRRSVVCLLAVAPMFFACGPEVVEPQVVPMLECDEMDPELVYGAETIDPYGLLINELGSNHWCSRLSRFAAGVVDPTTGNLVYATSEDGAGGQILRYTWNRWEAELDDDGMLPSDVNELNEELAIFECGDLWPMHRLFASAADGSVYFQCKDGVTRDLAGRPILAELDILLAIGADGRMLIGRVPAVESDTFYDPPATVVGELLGDGSLRPLQMPPELATAAVVAARSAGSGFRIAVRDPSDEIWILTVDDEGVARSDGSVSAAISHPYQPGYAAVLDGTGALYYLADIHLVGRGLDWPTFEAEGHESSNEWRAVFSGP